MLFLETADVAHEDRCLPMGDWMRHVGRYLCPLPCPLIDIRWVPKQMRGCDDIPRRLIARTSESHNESDIPRRARHSASPTYVSSFVEALVFKAAVPYILFVVVYDLLSMLHEEVLLVKYG